jgi:hypothetical protein
MSATAIRSALRTLADARVAAADAGEELKKLRAAFDAANIALIEDVERKRTAAAEAEGEARTLVDAHYRATKEKTPVKGAEVKVFKVYGYDAERALTWARETKLCLVPESLDVKAFEKVASVTALPFVTVKEEPRVQIATKLNPLDLVDPAPPAPAVAAVGPTMEDPL